MAIFGQFLNILKEHKTIVIVLLALNLGAIVLAVFAAINFSGNIVPINLNNIAYIEYLKGNYSFVSLLFASLFVAFLFISLIFLFCSKPFLFPFAWLFYLYFVYSQIFVYVSVIIIYGFFNVLILIVFLLLYLIVLFFLLMLLLVMLTYMDKTCYFKRSIKNPNFLMLSLSILVLTLAFCLILSLLKSFVIILVY